MSFGRLVERPGGAESAGAPARQPTLALREIRKSFGGVRALDGATLEVEPGTVHGLVGQNGAGKSTLIKVLAGLHQPDCGTVAVDGIAQNCLTPRAVAGLGIRFIHQDRLLPPSLTVGEAMGLGREATLGRLVPLLDRRAMTRRAEASLQDFFGLTLSRNALIAELSTAERQVVQIARALLDHPRIIVFDEPTAALVRQEAERLFALIRRLRREGVTVLYISHYLAEIERLCDRVTVLRNGRDVSTVDPKTTPAAAIVASMVERDIDDMFPKSRVPIGDPVLELSALGQSGRFTDVSLTIHAGEVVGLTGLVGSGAKDVARALFGLVQTDAGTIVLNGEPYRPRSPEAAVRRGVALVPEDRPGQGVALGLSVAENMTVASLDRMSRLGLLSRRRERREADRLIARLGVRTRDRNSPVRSLSGGNQQKVVLGKWLSRQARLYVLDEPTVGIDIASKVEIYRLIGDLVRDGAAVLLLSTDLPELVGISDRVLVMFRGRIAREFRAEDLSVEDILAEATTGTGAPMAAENAALAPGPDHARHTPRPQGRSRSLRQTAVRAGAYVVLFVVLGIFAVTTPSFATLANLGNVLGQSAILGVLAIGMTIVVIGGGPNVVSGGIDLSLAANMGFSAAAYATVIQGGGSDLLAAGSALGTGFGIGLVNSLAVVGFGIVPLLATLAVMNVVAGLELVLTENTAVPATTDFLAVLAGTGPFGLPVLSLVLIGIAAVAAVAVQATPVGLRLYAAGDFPEAARAAGLPVRRLVAATYVVSGGCGGLAGVLSVAYLSGSTTGAGDMLLSIVATALLGVMFSRRLLPTIGGTLLSTLFIGALADGFQLLNLSSYWVSGIEGALILTAVAATSLRPRRES